MPDVPPEPSVSTHMGRAAGGAEQSCFLCHLGVRRSNQRYLSKRVNAARTLSGQEEPHISNGASGHVQCYHVSEAQGQYFHCILLEQVICLGFKSE